MCVCYIGGVSAQFSSTVQQQLQIKPKHTHLNSIYQVQCEHTLTLWHAELNNADLAHILNFLSTPIVVVLYWPKQMHYF